MTYLYSLSISPICQTYFSSQLSTLNCMTHYPVRSGRSGGGLWRSGDRPTDGRIFAPAWKLFAAALALFATAFREAGFSRPPGGFSRPLWHFSRPLFGKPDFRAGPEAFRARFGAFRDRFPGSRILAPARRLFASALALFATAFRQAGFSRRPGGLSRPLWRFSRPLFGARRFCTCLKNLRGRIIHFRARNPVGPESLRLPLYHRLPNLSPSLALALLPDIPPHAKPRKRWASGVAAIIRC